MDYLIVSSLIAEVLILSRVDRRIFGTWLTPFSLLAYPYMVIVVLAFLFAPALDFAPLYVPSLLIWIVGLFILWAGGFVLGWGIFGLDHLPPDTASASRLVAPKSETEFWSVKWTIRATWVMAPILLLGLISTVRGAGGWAELGNIQYRTDYSHGLHSHLLIFGFAAIIMLIGSYGSGKKFQLMTIFLWMIFALASLGKGVIFQPIIGGLFFRSFRGNLRLSTKWVLIVVSCSFLAFVVLYMVAFSIVDLTAVTEWDVYSVLSRHYFYYLFAGPLSLSEAIHTHVTDVGGEWYTILSSFINLYRVTLGSTALVPAGSALEKGMDIDFQHDLTLGGANVYTFFGTLYLYLGLFGGMLYVLVVSLLCYSLLIHAKRTGNEWVLVAYCFIGAQLFFGFFELYFWYLTSLELLVYAFMLAAVAKWRRGRSDPGGDEMKVATGTLASTVWALRPHQKKDTCI